MKRIVFLLLAFLVCLTEVTAQPKNRKPFDSKRFEAELEQFITTEAGLTPQEASAFFPLYREMQRKQRACFSQMRKCRVLDTRDNAACENAIKRMDSYDVEIKLLQQEYHQRFMQVLPAGKVLEVIKAEDKFHRQVFKRAARHR